MDRATLEQQLAEAEQHVLLGMEHIVTERRIVFELGRERRDATMALELLKRFEETQALLIADRDRLRKDLSTLVIDDIAGLDRTYAGCTSPTSTTGSVLTCP